MTTIKRQKFEREVKIGWLITSVGIIASLTISGISLYFQLNPPQRAKMTIFIEDHRFSYEGNKLYFEVFGEITNDGAITGFIHGIDFEVTMNVSYDITLYTNILTIPSLSPLESTYFCVGWSFTGVNETVLLETNVKTSVATIWYEDASGMQQAQKEYGFVS